MKILSLKLPLLFGFSSDDQLQFHNSYFHTDNINTFTRFVFILLQFFKNLVPEMDTIQCHWRH